MANILRKIYSKVFPSSEQKAIATNLIKGESVFIDPSALLVTVDNGEIILQGNNYLGKNVELGTTGRIKIGDHTSLQDRCIILEDVEIGKSCVFAPNVYISSGRHYFDHKPNLYIKDQDALVAADPKLSQEHSKKVTIGDDCWLGINSVVMSGITIGRGCVIGANSVVTSNIEPFSIVGGIPAKIIKKRLEFTAKKNIIFSNEDDLPNFYKGFLVDSKNLAKSIQKGGIITEESFTCYLSTEGKTIAIELISTEEKNTKVIYNDQEKQVSGSAILEFNIGNNNYHDFKIEGANYVLVKSVTVKN